MRRLMTNWMNDDPWVMGVLEPFLLLLFIALIGALLGCSNALQRLLAMAYQFAVEPSAAMAPKASMRARRARRRDTGRVGMRRGTSS